MLLLTWHGTLVCLRQGGGGLVHLPVDAIGPDADPLDLDIGHARPEAPAKLRSVIGPLLVRVPADGDPDARHVGVVRYGQLLCADPEAGALAFDRTELSAWESFLPLTQAELDDLRAILTLTWVERASRRIRYPGAARLLDGFRLALDDATVDLERQFPRRLGAADAAAAAFLFTSAAGETEILAAGPRSSGLLATATWPIRARRTAEIMTLAAHRRILGREPEQDVFEADVAALMNQAGPPGLDGLLARLLDEAAPEIEPPAPPIEEVWPDPDAVIRSWALQQAASWRPGSVDPAAAQAYFSGLNDTTHWAFVYHIRDREVSMDAKPDGVGRDGIEIARAEWYRDLLQAAARLLPDDLDVTLCVSVEDRVVGRHAIPVFGFQRADADTDLLLPDVDFLEHGFYEAPMFEDTTPYEDKAETAVFAGATSGARITPAMARNLALPRLRAAAHFFGNPRVDFRLPNVVQCQGEAEAILRAQPFCQLPTLSLAEQMQHRLLLSMDGNGATCARVAIALHSNAVLVKYDSGDKLYYFSGLQPWVHYVPLRRDEDLEAVLDMQAADPDMFESIAGNGRRFAQTYLTRDAAERYTATLLEMYAGLFAPAVLADDPPAPAERQTDLPGTVLLAHVQEIGDTEADATVWPDRHARGLAMEGLAIFFDADLPREQLSYQVQLDGGGRLSGVARDGEFVGSRGRGDPLYGLRIMVDEDAAAPIQLAYSVRFTDGTEQGPYEAGELCASPAGAPLEALLVRIARRPPPDAGPSGPGIAEAAGAFGRAAPAPEPALSNAELAARANALLPMVREVAGLRHAYGFGIYDRQLFGPATAPEVVCLEISDEGAALRIDPDHRHAWAAMTCMVPVIFLIDAALARGTIEPVRFAGEFGDFGVRDDSVSFSSAQPGTLLLPDPDFVISRGHLADRRMVSALAQPWADRRPVVFWRGATTGRARHAPPPPGEADDFTWLPRLDMCHRARLSPHASSYDVGIATFVQLDDPALRARIEAAGLCRPSAERADFARCKAILVIDGNSNARSALFRALLSGACVLKVESEQGFRQWYYHALKPWVHYIPVRADLADMDDAVAWVMAHDSEARGIGMAGREFAEALTFSAVVEDAAVRLREWIKARVLF